jgi:hypothetical protein
VFYTYYFKFTIISLLYISDCYDYFQVSYYFTAYFIIVLFQYYFTIILIIFTIISDYFRVLHPYFQELADANLHPTSMRRGTRMTDKCPGVPAKLCDDQASLLYEAKPTYSAERRQLYALFLVLFLLFQLSVQDLAAGNIDQRTAGRYTTIL